DVSSIDAICFFTPIFFNVTSVMDFYLLSLHDALPILIEDLGATPADKSSFCFHGNRSCSIFLMRLHYRTGRAGRQRCWPRAVLQDRKSTRLNSSHRTISYAVFCLKKKNICTFMTIRVL